MVERLFETPIVKNEGNIYTDTPLDKDSFVEQVYKKKEEKKDDDIIEIAASVARYIQLPDSKNQVYGGGYFSAEDNVGKFPHAAKKSPTAAVLLAISGEQRRTSILAAVKINGSELPGERSSRKEQAVAVNDKPSSGNSSSIEISKNNTVNANVPLMQSVLSAQQILNGKQKSALESTTANAAITNAHSSFFAELQMQAQRTEITKGHENQRSPMNAMLEKTIKHSAVSVDNKPDAASRSFDIDYPFQRWAGDHSVKISIPTEARRDANITLLPSDTRAADALSRQMVHLSGHTAELLKPEQDSEERERRQQQQNAQDEEQE
ncbi:hypothetical protein [Pectobacterium versatile]|uniref:SpaN/EivJ family type III secretion system needle length determinant n=1 Tax=Pectobacterium versatile TaxID=2488639 RepID=UPI001CCB52B1|nr:hypothetical protein [Pectobacterium versatile]